MAQTNRFRSVCATREGLVVLHPHRALPLHFTALVLHFVETAAPCLQGFRRRSSIVGYQTVDIPTGYSMFTPTFEDVQGGDFTLGDITVCNATTGVELDDNASGAGRVRNTLLVMKLKDGLCEVGTAMSYTTGGYANKGANWGWKANKGVVLAAGEGIIVQNESGVPLKFLVAGGVKLVPQYNIPTGYSIFGNNTPNDITLGDITVCNATTGVELDDNASGAGRVRNTLLVMKLKEGRCEVATAMSYTTGGYANKGANWGWKANKNVSIAAGEALIVQNESGMVLKFKLKEPVAQQ